MPTDRRHRLMIAGEVFKLRLDTADIMACIDAAELAQIPTVGMSMAQVVKWGIVAMCQTLREQQVLPERDGFDYAQLTERYRRTTLGAKVKVGIQMAASEVGLKMSDRTVAIQSAQTVARIEGEELTLKVPAEVRRMAPCGRQDLAVINSKVVLREANLTVEELAKWLLYAENRDVASHVVSQELITAAEERIRVLWPEYPSVLLSLV